MWLEFSLFIEVVEKDSATHLKVVFGYFFLSCSSAALIAIGWDILLYRQDVICMCLGACMRAHVLVSSSSV